MLTKDNKRTANWVLKWGGLWDWKGRIVRLMVVMVVMVVRRGKDEMNLGEVEGEGNGRGKLEDEQSN